MVTIVDTRQVETRQPTLEELGESLGIPMKVRPWWGSRRARNRRIHVGCEAEVFDAWNWGRHIIEPWCPKCRSFLKLSDIRIDRAKRTWLCPRISYPQTENGAVVVWEGNCGLKGHNHCQSIEVVDVNDGAMVIAVRAGNGVYRCGRNFLIAKDNGRPFATALTRYMLTVQDAYDWLVPKFVREAYIVGKDVKRQGDWFFVPSDVDPVNQYRSDSDIRVSGADPELFYNRLYERVHLTYSGVQTRHVGEQVVYRSLLGTSYGAPRVKGEVTAPDHPPLELEGWHIGVRRRTAPGTNDRVMNPGLD